MPSASLDLKVPIWEFSIAEGSSRLPCLFLLPSILAEENRPFKITFRWKKNLIIIKQKSLPSFIIYFIHS